MESIWVYKDRPTESQIEKLKGDVKLPELILRLLNIRGYQSKREIENFLSVENGNYHDPFLMEDMDKGVSRIIKALINREKMLIWGDYDVDGVTSTSLLYMFLSSMGGDIDYNIPSRELDGYGLSITGLDEIKAAGISLVLTVDCGITSVEQTEYAKKLGIDIVISDHHEPGAELPAAIAVIDPKRNDCKYPFKHLAGVGVAFKIIQGILKKSEMPISEADEYLDIVAFGTVSDIVPLIDENRYIVTRGLSLIRDSKKIGFQALIKKLNLNDKPFKVNNILFGLAPRINAAGRMGDAKRAVRLLVSNNDLQANELVNDLEMENERRKEFDHHTLIEAIKLNEEQNLHNPADYAIIIAHQDWHVGVIGIVASRLVEKYHCPAVVISIEDGVGKGSCRSIPGVNIYEVLNECSDLLKQFGGHEYAAGLEIDMEMIPDFKRRFNQAVQKYTVKGEFIYKREIDMEIDLNCINDELMSFLYKFEPFGPENKQPVFVSRNVQVVGSIRIVGVNHLRMKLKQNGVVYDAIGFNLANKYHVAELNREKLDIAYNIEENYWNGNTYIQLKLKDLKGEL